MKSPRSHTLHTITYALLLFGGPCYALWLRAPPSQGVILQRNLIDSSHSQDDNSRALAIDNDPLGNQPEDTGSQKSDNYWTPQQVMRFLEGNAMEQKIHSVSSNLRTLLRENNDQDLPIVFEEQEEADRVGEEEKPQTDPNNELETYLLEEFISGNEIGGPQTDSQPLIGAKNEFDGGVMDKDKRSGRYYRRYPFKRRNNRYYEHPTKNCKPTREEVVKLLIALHKYQNGNKDAKSVRFCKRNRPLGNIITNMRFLG